LNDTGVSFLDLRTRIHHAEELMKNRANFTSLVRALLSGFTAALAVAVCLTRIAHAAGPDLRGTIKVDGSSTVFPISEAVAEEFQKSFRQVKVTVGVSGTGGGFKKFSAGEVDVVNASRPIKAAELELCTKSGIDFIELPIAYDALSIVVNPRNTWAQALTVKELARIWAPEAQGKVTSWSQVRAGFPDRPLQLFGAGTDSGTFDYFTEAIVGKEDASRGDYTSSEDDNVLVTGVAGNEGALGFMGFAYYEGNKDKLKVVAVDDGNEANGGGAQLPSVQNVTNGVYQPLSRPLFIYVRRSALERPEVQEFVSFYVENAGALAAEVGYIALPDAAYSAVAARLRRRALGSVFAAKGVSTVGMKIEQLLKAE
jgi:phosphate transport system substrate-binding protein